MKLKHFLQLIRVHQWYKNLVIFLPIVFVGQVIINNQLNIPGLTKTFLGFIVLCLISSSSYIINDLIDRKKDLFHPEKKNRPLASEKVSIKQAFLVFLILFTLSILTAFNLSLFFLYSILTLFLFNLAYSLFLKNEMFLDILIIAINFVIRAISGTFIIQVSISPWLILCTFLLSLFLSVGKRHSDLIYLKEEAINHKPVLKDYTKEITNVLMIISTSLLIIAYSLYSFLSNYKNLIYTLPLSLYVIFRYFYLIYTGSIIARHPEKILKDKKITIGIILWLILIFLIIYY